MQAGQHPVSVSQPVFRLIERALAVSLLPESSFNLAIGPLVKCWKIGFQGKSVPARAEIQAKLALTHPENIELDAANRSVFLKQAGMEIDLGAIAKGYIADRVQAFYMSRVWTARSSILAAMCKRSARRLMHRRKAGQLV